MQLREEMYKIVKTRQSLENEVVGYQIPDSEFDAAGRLDSQKKLNKLLARYSEPKEIETHGESLDQFEWEARQSKVCMILIEMMI